MIGGNRLDIVTPYQLTRSVGPGFVRGTAVGFVRRGWLRSARRGWLRSARHDWLRSARRGAIGFVRHGAAGFVRRGAAGFVRRAGRGVSSGATVSPFELPKMFGGSRSSLSHHRARGRDRPRIPAGEGRGWGLREGDRRSDLMRKAFGASGAVPRRGKGVASFQ